MKKQKEKYLLSRLTETAQACGTKMPIALHFKLHKMRYDKSQNGNDARYFRICFLGDDGYQYDISRLIGSLLNLRISTAKDTVGDVIVHGSNMDMAYAVQAELRNLACNAGYPCLFAEDYASAEVQPEWK